MSYISGQFQKEYTITVICLGGCKKQEIEKLKRLGIFELIIVELNDVLSCKFQNKSIVDFIENELKKCKSSLAIFRQQVMVVCWQQDWLFVFLVD